MCLAKIASMWGMSGLICFGSGLLLLGGYALATGRVLNFDATKHILKRYRAPILDWVIWLTMRDFLALAAAMMTILGLAKILLIFFGAGACVWLMVTASLIAREIWPLGRRIL